MPRDCGISGNLLPSLRGEMEADAYRSSTWTLDAALWCLEWEAKVQGWWVSLVSHPMGVLAQINDMIRTLLACASGTYFLLMPKRSFFNSSHKHHNPESRRYPIFRCTWYTDDRQP